MLNDETNRSKYDPESGDPNQYEKENAATSEQGQQEQDQSTQYRYTKNSIPFQNNFDNQNMGYQNNGFQNQSYQNASYQNMNGAAQNMNGNAQNMNGAAGQSYGQGAFQNNYQNNYQSQYNQRFNQTAGQNNAFGSKPEKDKKKKEKKKAGKNGSAFMKHKAVTLIASAAVFGIIAGGIMFGINYAGGKFVTGRSNSTYEIATVTPNISTSNVQSEDDNLNTSMNVESVAQAALPAMVQLNGVTTVSGSSSSYGYGGLFGGSSQAQTSGTGIIVGKNDTELLILTNAHVITDVNNLTCVFVDGKSVSATVKGSKTDKDIAVVAVSLSDIDTESLGKIAIAELSDSDDVVLGQQVVAIGNALGEGQSVTSGIVSALNRSITVDNVTFTGLFMTDAAINSGNSGGALLNAAGKVVAINFAKTSTDGVEGMAYSIPVSNVKDLIDSLMNRETRAKVSADKTSYLGITAVDITSSMASSYGYPQGVLIRQVASGSPAEKAGLGSYDIIVSFDDQTVTSMSGLQSTMQYYAAGETIKLEYYHLEGSEYVLKTVDVVLDKKQ